MNSGAAPVLVIGASGLVGGELHRQLKRARLPVCGTYHAHPSEGLTRLDLAQYSEVADLLDRVRPGVILCPAAQPNVDLVEKEPEAGRRVNVEGLRNLCQAAVSHAGARLVYFSTDFVFDGVGGPYSESDLPSPISEYGRQKAAGESLVRDWLGERGIIVRTTVVFGWERHRKNFAIRVIDSLRAGLRVRAPVDQIGTPTFCPNLAEAVFELVEIGFTGLIHLVGPDLIDRYNFARLIASEFGLNGSLIDAVTARELGQVAPRPMQAGLRTDLARSILRRSPLLPAQQGLVRMRASEADPL